MVPRVARPIEYFNEWLAEPIVIQDHSVAGVIEALNHHPMSRDETAQDYVMPLHRCGEHPGRFRIYRENQENFRCFVYEGDESKVDPPVFFESCLELHKDYGVSPSEIIGGDHVLVAERFTDFLWQILGHHICLRTESQEHLANNVSGIAFGGSVALDDSFVNPLRKEFIAGYTCFVSKSAVCIPDWGAAFLNADSRAAFVSRYMPTIWKAWHR